MTSETTAPAGPVLQVENVQVAALSLALAVKRGAFSVEEVENVSLCYKNLKCFLEAWQKAHPKEETQAGPS